MCEVTSASEYYTKAINRIKLVEILQELAESEPKACPKHQIERWTNIS